MSAKIFWKLKAPKLSPQKPKERRKLIKQTVNRAVKEYGESLSRLAKE